MKSSIFWRSLVLLMLVALIVGCGVETAVPVPLPEAEQLDIEATVAASIAATQTAESQNNPPEQPTSEPPPPESEPAEEPTDAPPPQPLPDNNPELLLPFRDDFDDGLDPTWRVINGKPLVVEGRLTSANNELSMELGNTALKNYTIELDIGGEDPTRCRRTGDITFGFSPALHYIYRVNFSSGIADWYSFEANEWEKISQSKDLECGHTRIVVNGNRFQITINGQLAEDVIFEYAEGPLLLRLEEEAYIDNFVISP